jgi:phage terminase small subunit
MAVLGNSRHELFAQELAKGKIPQDAYAAAGYKPDPGNAFRLQKKNVTRQRVAELLTERDNVHVKATERAVEALAIDKAWTMRELMEEGKRASKAGQSASAIRALELLGKEIGMFIDRKEVTNFYATLSDAELDATIARLDREIEAAADKSIN